MPVRYAPGSVELVQTQNEMKLTRIAVNSLIGHFRPYFVILPGNFSLSAPLFVGFKSTFG